jgi:protein N-terminal glutamine amidohydrolase
MQTSYKLKSTEISDSNRAKFLYCSHFCEENVYKMAGNIIEDMRSHRESCVSASLFVVFISSECKRTPVWHQKAGIHGEPVLWDYHVVLVAKGISRSLLRELFSAEFSDFVCDQVNPLSNCTHSPVKSEVESSQQPIMQIVFDLDTELPFPTDAKEYYKQSFRPDLALHSSYEQRFRVIPAEDFVSHFSSDRSDNFQRSYSV